MDVAASLKLINDELEAFPPGHPRDLYEPMEYALGLESQRLFPLLTLWGCYLFSGNNKNALTPSLGVEVFYNFLMVHSDLLDGNLQRQNQQSVQQKWNRNVAILSGDAMIFKAYELLIQVAPELIKPVVKKFNRCFIKVCEGKQLALNNPGKKEDHDILELNPGALGAFSLELGALIAGANSQQQAHAGQLGTAIVVSQNSPVTNIQSFNPSILQSLDSLTCDDQRKQEFKQYLLNL